MGRTPCCEKEGLKKGPWTPDEDQKLISFIVQHGHGNWRALPKKCGLLRCGKSCRLRWTNYLRPDIKRGQFTYSEEQKIIHLHALLGNKWAFIASQLPKRTDNEIKNHWNTVLKKRLQKMGLNEVVYQQNGPDSVSSSESKPGGSTLNHLVQWESARLEAEARLAKESQMRAKGSWAGITFKAGSSVHSHTHQMPSKLQDAPTLLKQSGHRGMHPMSFASSLENSLQMNQLLRATAISSPSGSPLSSESVELRPAKSNLSSVHDFNSSLKLTSNGSITWNSQELLPKDSATADFLRFSKLCSETLDEGAESDPRPLYVHEKALPNVTKGEQLLPPDGGTCNAFSDLHELLFGDDSGSCLSPTSTAPWSQSSRHEASIHGSRTDMEEGRESEVTMTTSSQLMLQEETPRHARVKTSAPKVNICLSVKDFMELEVDKARPQSYVLKENEADAKDSLQLLQYDSMDEENSSHWNNFFCQLVDSPCARPLSNSVTLGHGIAGV